MVRAVPTATASRITIVSERFQGFCFCDLCTYALKSPLHAHFLIFFLPGLTTLGDKALRQRARLQTSEACLEFSNSRAHYPPHEILGPAYSVTAALTWDSLGKLLKPPRRALAANPQSLDSVGVQLRWAVAICSHLGVRFVTPLQLAQAAFEDGRASACRAGYQQEGHGGGGEGGARVPGPGARSRFPGVFLPWTLKSVYSKSRRTVCTANATRGSHPSSSKGLPNIALQLAALDPRALGGVPGRAWVCGD